MIEDFSAYFDSGVWVGGAQVMCAPFFLTYSNHSKLH